MTKNFKNRWVDYLVFGLSLFLLFCLIFESYIELPRLVAWVGRWHPLLIHFPIVLLLICAFLGLMNKKIPKVLLTFSVLTALLTAISGFFLGQENSANGELLFWHQWLGGALALLAAVWYWLEGIQFDKPIFNKALQVILVGLIIFTGHYGGMVTHGEDFLALPIEKREAEIPENPLIYDDVVARILDKKCVSCHNPNKKKGELLMTSLDNLLAGGEVRNTVVPGNPQESEIIRRLHLPFEDEEHMPPEGKQPLDPNEIQILERWISLGASDTLRIQHLEPSEPLVDLINELMMPDPMEKWAKLPIVADSTLRRLSSDYVTIRRVAAGINAVSVNLYKSPTYRLAQLTSLQSIAEHIVQLDASGLPIGQEEMNFFASCPNLEWLEIDQTPITDVEMDTLKVLSKLKMLKVYNTPIGDQSIPVLKKMEALKQVYLWNTAMSVDALRDLQKEKPALFIDSGIDEELQASFVGSDSIPKN